MTAVADTHLRDLKLQVGSQMMAGLPELLHGGRESFIGGYRRTPSGPAMLRHPKPFFAPKTLHLRMIDCPAFSAGVVIGRSEPAPRMFLGILAKLGSQGGVGGPLAWQRRVRVVGLRRAARSRDRQTAH
jgi:hypothetical protein